MTTKFAVVGSPIDHSLSPTIHLAAYQALGLDFDYERLELQKGSLGSFLSDTVFSGLSVTMPLKEEAFLAAKNSDDYSKLVGNSNTLLSRDGDWISFNTDILGIKQALRPVGLVNKVLVIGTGSTAKSFLVALSEISPKAEVAIWGRDQFKALALIEFALTLGLRAMRHQNLSEGLEEFDLVASTVPSGALDSFWSNQRFEHLSSWLFDVSYSPWPSTAAKVWQSGRVISGIEMLKWQAVGQIRIFADEYAPGILVPDETYFHMTQALQH